MTGQIAESIRRNPATCTTINYLASHNGFTLNDAVSYSSKHNEDNGEDNRDGSNYNYGCNYGVEGPTTSRRIQKLRSRQLRNAFLLLLLSQGVPAIYGGDEMGNSQQGNNNIVRTIRCPGYNGESRLLTESCSSLCVRQSHFEKHIRLLDRHLSIR